MALWSKEELIQVLRDVETIADSAGDPDELILEIRAAVKEVLE